MQKAVVWMIIGALAAAGMIAASGPVGAGHGSFAYTLADGGGAVSPIVPFESAGTVVAWYGYDTSVFDSAATLDGVELSNTAVWFLHHGTDGISIGVVLDTAGDGSGGFYSLDSSGVAGLGALPVVKDDPFDLIAPDFAFLSWLSCCTDGVAWNGGLDGAFDATFTALSASGLPGGAVWASPDGAGGIDYVPFPLIGPFTVHAAPDVPAAVPPGPPTDVDAGPGQIEGDGLVTWSPPDDDGGAPITAYHVYGGASPEALALVGSVGGDTTEFTVPGDGEWPKPEASYWAVAAENIAGEGPLSEPVCGVIHGAAVHEHKLCDDWSWPPSGTVTEGGGPPPHAKGKRTP